MDAMWYVMQIVNLLFLYYVHYLLHFDNDQSY